MSSSNDQLAKKARLQRHVRRDNVLKARFSPTAIWTTPTAIEPPFQTSTNVAPTSTPPAAVTSTTPTQPLPIGPHTPVTPTLLSTSIKPVSTSSTTTSTSATSASITTTSSTSTSTSTSTTSSTTTTSKTTSTTPVIKPPVTTPLSTPLPSSPATAYVTTTLGGTAVAAISGSLTGSAASQTASTTATSGVSTAGIVGIAAASIVGVAVLAGIIVFFFRRWSRRDEEFSPADFRRQSVALRDDSPSLYRGNSGGRGPRPPTMIERRNMAGFTSHTQPMNAPQPSYPFGNPSPFNDFASPQPSPSFGPGQVIPSFPPAHMEGQGQYANAAPFFNPAFQSPMGSPVTVASYGGAAFDGQGRLIRSPSNAATPTLSRGNSMAHSHHPGSPPIPEDAEYADLSRASVTPFQAAQYAAISKQLNIPPPMPLRQVTEGDEHEEFGHNLPVYEDHSGSPMDVSPFDDSRGDVKQSFGDNTGDDFKPSRPSSEFHSANPIALTREPSTRITSIPPTLPELQMSQRAFSPVDYNFPATPSPRSATFDASNMRNPAGAVQEPSPLGRASPKVDLPPLSPVPHSPQRAQFVSGVESHAHNGRETPVEIGFVAENAVVAPAPQRAEVPRSQVSEKKRPETLYDDEDAYGGF